MGENNGDQEGNDMLRDEPLFKYFQFGHLPPNLQVFSAPWYNLAKSVILNIPRSAERTVALRKLLEGKDCAVRAMLP